MHENATVPLPHDVFSAEEIAEAARVKVAAVVDALDAGYVPSFRGYVATADALLLVRILRAGGTAAHERAPISLLALHKRRGGAGLAASGVLHAAAVLILLFVTSMGFIDATTSDLKPQDPTPQKLVYMVAFGPGGGGGGGGLKVPAPPPKAQRKPLVRLVRRTPSPVPPVVRRPPPPPPPQPLPARPPIPVPLPRPTVQPVQIEQPKPQPAPAVQAPVVSAPTDPVDMPGLVANRKTPDLPSAGPGSGGGIGSGAGTGMGEGSVGGEMPVPG